MMAIFKGTGVKTLLLFSALVAVSLLIAVLMEWSAAAVLIVLGLNAMVPIALAATGEIINERGGLANVGIEGILILSAFVAVFLAEVSGNYYAGIIGAGLFGALLGMAFGLLTTYGRGTQIIAGFGLNLTAIAAVSLLLILVWGAAGHHVVLNSDLRGPVFNIGYGAISWFVPASIVLAILAIWLLDETRLGMRLKASGYNPFVTDVAGCNTYRLRTIGATIGGAFAGLGGGYLSLDFLGVVTRDISQGRGFIALAALVFAGLGVPRAVLVCFLFGLTEGISLWLQNAPWAKSFIIGGGNFFLLMIPYLAVLIALIAFPQAGNLSRLIGVTYRRDQ